MNRGLASIPFLCLALACGIFTTFNTMGHPTDGGITTWKLYGPELNGVGGLEGVSSAPGVFTTVVADVNGNILAEYATNGIAWYPSRVCGYGAVPGYRPLPLGGGANVQRASAWRGKWTDITGYVWLGARYYNPESGGWLSFDPVWNDGDPTGFNAFKGNPIQYFDPSGRYGKDAVNTAGGAILGFGESFFGANVGVPSTTEEYNGREFGRVAGELASIYLTAKGGADFTTGLGVMGGSLTLEIDSGGTLSIVAGPGAGIGALQAGVGTLEAGLGSWALNNSLNVKPLQQPPQGGSSSIDPGDDGAGQSRLRDPETGRFVSDPNNPPSPYDFTDAQRRAAWKQLAQDPNSPLDAAQRQEIESRGWRGPQRLNKDTGEWETMELSHEPIPLRDGGTQVVPRWPDEHAAIDPHRQLRKTKP